MHDIWNPWHGCKKCSEGCRNCYMYYLDAMRDKHGEDSLSYQGKPIAFKLTDEWGYPIPAERRYQPYYGEKCQTCGMKLTCNGCSRCGKCL